MNKDKQYSAIYFPVSMIEERERTWFSLIDIDCNFSKLIQILLFQIRKLSDFIATLNLNFRHFDWILVIRNKKTKEIFYCKEIGNDKKGFTSI